MHYVYVLKSETTGVLYKGFTSDLKSRVKLHFDGKVKSTKSGRPWVLVYYEAFSSEYAARGEEKFLKSGK